MKATIQYIEKELAGVYPNTEIDGFKRLIFEAVCGWGFTEQVAKKQERISVADFEKIESIVSRLINFEPIQYILEETEFYGLRLKVNPSVLIPRSETEELVQWIIQSKLPVNARFLDIGTGSGCIALALKNQLKNTEITGIDISEMALETAIKNARLNNLDVRFFQADILKWEAFSWEKYDVIVSNPPYIRESEKQQMHANVLEHEPPNALFVTDSDPLVFYRAISAFSRKYLTEKGMLYFEINENLGSEICELLLGNGFGDIEIRKDINGKNRMVCCRNMIF